MRWRGERQRHPRHAVSTAPPSEPPRPCAIELPTRRSDAQIPVFGCMNCWHRATLAPMERLELWPCAPCGCWCPSPPAPPSRGLTPPTRRSAPRSRSPVGIWGATLLAASCRSHHLTACASSCRRPSRRSCGPPLPGSRDVDLGAVDAAGLVLTLVVAASSSPRSWVTCSWTARRTAPSDASCSRARPLLFGPWSSPGRPPCGRGDGTAPPRRRAVGGRGIASLVAGRRRRAVRAIHGLHGAGSCSYRRLWSTTSWRSRSRCSSPQLTCASSRRRSPTPRHRSHPAGTWAAVEADLVRPVTSPWGTGCRRADRADELPVLASPPGCPAHGGASDAEATPRPRRRGRRRRSDRERCGGGLVPSDDRAVGVEHLDRGRRRLAVSRALHVVAAGRRGVGPHHQLSSATSTSRSSPTTVTTPASMSMR